MTDATKSWRARMLGSRGVVIGLAAGCAVLAQATASLAQSRGVVVLVPGAGGARPNDFLVRNQAAYRAAGFQTVIAVGASEAARAAQSQHSGKIYAVGMSAGATHLAQAIAAGARFDRVVFVSAAYVQPLRRQSGVGAGVMVSLGDPALLPPTGVVHNSNDACVLTPPGGVGMFVDWARGRAKAQWVASTATQSEPCHARSPHGYFEADDAATRAVLGFLR